MEPEKINYIFRYYALLMSQIHKDKLEYICNIQNFIFITNQVENITEAQYQILYDRYNVTKEEVEKYQKDDYRILREDYLKLREEIARDILLNHSDKVYFNYCSVCGQLARTPRAKQAKCGHRWK